MKSTAGRLLMPADQTIRLASELAGCFPVTGAEVSPTMFVLKVVVGAGCRADVSDVVTLGRP